VFNRCRLVIPREPITSTILSNLGIKTVSNIIINDVGFWLETAGKERLKEIFESEKIDTHVPMVGISVSQSFVRFRSDSSVDVGKNYFKAILDAIEFCVNKLNTNILLIPHVTGPDTERHDDRVACENLYILSEHKDNIYLLRGRYKADELKGLISQCRFFIGARMHANIAALSSCIPTLAMSYSHKTEGIMKLLGLERWVYSDFAAPIDNVLSELVQNREEIQRSLEAKMTEFEHNRYELISLLRIVANE
jgi:colanic acid/amylovoran biosynthesis protein